MAFLEKLAEKGKPVPALENQPELYSDLVEVWQAFQDLNNSRTIGLDINPISFGEMEAWLRLHHITDRDEQEQLCYLIKRLDEAWLNHRREKHKKKSENKKNGNPKAGNRR